MMNETRLKYIFSFLSAILLFLMVLTSRDAGISCDEVLHYNQSVSVYNFFATNGTDQSALNTPSTHLKYYGQSYDNLVTILINWFKIDDVYRFRHLMSSIAGWLTIVISALFAAWLTDFRAAIIVLILFAVSPAFMGHSQNNLKDIPFALGYITSTFLTLKFLVSGRKISVINLFLLTAGIAFTISIRAGGLIVLAYLFLFLTAFYLFRYLNDKTVDYIEIRIKLFWIIAIAIISCLLSILLWPFALQSPLKNILESYRVMAHFPDTFRQIFEGRVEWSDFMPWYYLPKSMAITIPFIVLAGLVLFIIFSKLIFIRGKTLLYGLVIFTVLFPVVFVIYEKSNLYSSWRQFLFIYPGIIVLAAIGFVRFFEDLRNKYFMWIGIAWFAIMGMHPLKFMIANHPYYYLYYNQIVGGLRGAYSNYEMDYYYVSQSEASEWLINYLNENKITGSVKVKATYSVLWQFREHPEIETSYFRYEERSMYDWDYAIVVNRYISPSQLKNKIWPPKNAIHVINVDHVPVCAVLERKSKDDYYGYTALNEGRSGDAIKYFEQVLKTNDGDEMIFYNFAVALYNEKQYLRADSTLKSGLDLNADFELILMYLGNIARSQNKTDEAVRYYERVINANRKYFEAYVGLSELLVESDMVQARKILRRCLEINPGYKPAIIALADTYRKSDPDIAEKYDELAKTIK